MLPWGVRRLALQLAIGGSLLALLGCAGGNSKGPKAPALSPDEAGAGAMAEYDANKDGGIDAKEAEKCPALKTAFQTVDRDQDGKITAKEIANRLRLYQEHKVAVMSIPCQVFLDNFGLAGATVTFVPEKFMGPNVPPATGVSEEDGNVDLQIGGEKAPGLHCGFYRVTVSKKDAKGKETIHARFNTQTTLGFEIAPDMRDGVLMLQVRRG
jgi:hypothetical protein